MSSLDFDPTIDFYKALGVERGASESDIKRAYRKLAKQFHPDSTGGDKKKEAKFKDATVAYEVLGDKTKRAQYDEIREQLRHMPPGYDPRRGPAPHARQGGGPGPQVFDLNDLFSQFFASQGGGGQVHVDDPFQGFGAGSRRQNRAERRRPQPAPEAEHKVRASDGGWLTVKGSDVHSDVRLPFQDAILGTVRELATIDGTSSVKIPPGTSSGQRLRLKGKGVTTRTGEPGDHYVTVHIDVPRDLDDDAKRRLVELVTHVEKTRKR